MQIVLSPNDLASSAAVSILPMTRKRSLMTGERGMMAGCMMGGLGLWGDTSKFNPKREKYVSGGSQNMLILHPCALCVGIL